MKQQEAIDNLINGARNCGCEYLNVRRDDLLIALGAEPTNIPESIDNGHDAKRNEAPELQG